MSPLVSFDVTILTSSKINDEPNAIDTMGFNPTIDEISRFPTPDIYTTSIASNGSIFWMGAYSTLYVINATNGEIISQSTNTSRRYLDLDWGGDGLWTTNYDRNRLIKVNVTSGEEMMSFDHVWTYIYGIAYSPDGLYVYDTAISKIYLYNDTTGSLIRDFDLSINNVGSIDYYNGFLWISRTGSYQQVMKISEIDGTMKGYIDISDVSGRYTGIFLANQTMWIINEYTDSAINYNISKVSDLLFFPDQDTYVRTGSDTINGLSSALFISNRDTTFIRFPIDQINISISAYLEVYNWASRVLTIDVHGVTDDTWDELTMNSQNTPSIGPIEDSVIVYGIGWISLNVTDIIQAETDGYVTFALTSTSNDAIGLNSINSNNYQVPHLAINGSIYDNSRPNRPITEIVTEIDTTTQTYTDTTTETSLISVTKTITETTTSYENEVTNTITTETTITNQETNYVNATLSKNINQTESNTNFPIFFFILSISIIPLIKRIRKKY